jgi:hypothetical protein
MAMHYSSDSIRHLAACTLVLTVAGCELDVSNPGIIDASTFDPVADARIISMSAQQNFYDVYADVINSTALYSGEVWTGAVRQESNDIARRAIVDTNIDLNASFWAPLQVALATNDQVVDVLRTKYGERDLWPGNNSRTPQETMWTRLPGAPPGSGWRPSAGPSA